MNNWNEWKRMLINIDKALLNEEVNEFMKLHYCYLHSKLVKIMEDEDVFNDTYLRLTYRYDPNEDFILLFLYHFNLLKGAYYRDSKVTKWIETKIEPYEFAEVSEEPEVIDNKNFMNELKAGLNALSKQSTKD